MGACLLLSLHALATNLGAVRLLVQQGDVGEVVGCGLPWSERSFTGHDV